MKLTEDFINKLTDLSKIGTESILLQSGKVQSMKKTDQVLATVVLEDDLPDVRAGVKDISNFLNTLKLFEPGKANLEFQNEYINIVSDRQEVKYYLVREDFISNAVASQDAITLKNSGALGEVLVDFDISEEMFTRICDTIKVLGAEHVALEVDSGTLKAVIRDFDNSAHNNSEIEIGPVDSPDFRYVFEAATFMLVPKNDYSMSIYDKISSVTLTNDNFAIFLASLIKNTIKAN